MMEVLDNSMFGVLPNEKMLELCQRMDNMSLANFIRTYGRAYQVCNIVMKSRWEAFINIIANQLSVDTRSFFGKSNQEALGSEIYDLNVYAQSYIIDVIRGEENIYIEIKQYYNQPGTPWLFQGTINASVGLEQPIVIKGWLKKGFVQGYRSTFVEMNQLRHFLSKLVDKLYQSEYVLRHIEDLNELDD